jgi:hypothetical protein
MGKLQPIGCCVAIFVSFSEASEVTTYIVITMMKMSDVKTSEQKIGY